jgi:hypothetical protein
MTTTLMMIIIMAMVMVLLIAKIERTLHRDKLHHVAQRSAVQSGGLPTCTVFAASVIRTMSKSCPDDVGGKNLRNIGRLQPDYTAQLPRNHVFVLAAVRTWIIVFKICFFTGLY